MSYSFSIKKSKFEKLIYTKHDQTKNALFAALCVIRYA